MEFAAVVTAAGQPGTKGTFTNQEGFFESGCVDPKGQQPEYQLDSSRMSLEAIEYRMSPRREFVFAGLAEQILNIFLLTVSTVAHQGVNAGIADSVIVTSWIRTGIAFGHNPFLSTAFAFDELPRSPRSAAEWEGRGEGGRGARA